jgi:hypothetical protein
MDSIIVGFSTPKSGFQPFSWLIRLAYLSPFSHAYVRIQLDELDENIVFQASGLVVNFIGESLFDTKENIYKEFTFSIKDKKKLLQFAVNQLGKPYSVTGILGMAVVRLGQLIGVKINNPFQYDQTSDFCSELVAYILENYDGVKIETPVANLAPADLYKIVAALPISQST